MSQGEINKLNERIEIMELAIQQMHVRLCELEGIIEYEDEEDSDLD